MKYNYIISGSLNNKPKTLDVSLDGSDQRDSFKYFMTYCNEFDPDGIDNIEFTGKY